MLCLISWIFDLKMNAKRKIVSRIISGCNVYVKIGTIHNFQNQEKSGCTNQPASQPASQPKIMWSF
jgi:hypothetical protein